MKRYYATNATIARFAADTTGNLIDVGLDSAVVVDESTGGVTLYTYEGTYSILFPTALADTYLKAGWIRLCTPQESEEIEANDVR